MAVPKRKTSKAKKRQRRGHDKLSTKALSFDEKIGGYRRSHYIDANGYYNGRKVLDVK